MNKSNILISDTSSIRFDFLFVHEKPVITLDINKDEMKGMKENFLQIGRIAVIKKEHIHNSKIKILINSHNKSLIKTIYNKGANSIKFFYQPIETLSKS